MTITSPDGTITTQDAPGVSVLDTVADLIGGLYLVILLALFAGGYVVLAIRTAIGVDVALRLLHDGYSTVAAAIAATVGLALAVFLVYRLARSARPRRPRRPRWHRVGAAVS